MLVDLWSNLANNIIRGWLQIKCLTWPNFNQNSPWQKHTCLLPSLDSGVRSWRSGLKSSGKLLAAEWRREKMPPSASWNTEQQRDWDKPFCSCTQGILGSHTHTGTHTGTQIPHLGCSGVAWRPHSRTCISAPQKSCCSKYFDSVALPNTALIWHFGKGQNQLHPAFQAVEMCTLWKLHFNVCDNWYHTIF